MYETLFTASARPTPTETDLTEGVGVRRHVRQDDQHVQVALVGEVLGRGQSQTRRDDTLDRGVVREVEEQGRPLHRPALLEVVPEESVSQKQNQPKTRTTNDRVKSVYKLDSKISKRRGWGLSFSSTLSSEDKT